MIDKLISYETAVLAKEKEFSEECYEHYTIMNDKSIILQDNEAGYQERPNIFVAAISLNQFLHSYTRDNEFLAPTQSLLQRWLREKHNIYCGVAPVIYAGDNKASYYQATLNTNTIMYKERFNNYESALEHSLQEGLKLIKT